MPMSPAHKIYPVMSIFQQLPEVKSVLDIGAGFGKFGVLLREHLDIRLMRYRKEDWRTTIDCIEIWHDYINPIHRYVYDCIYIGDAVQLSKTIPNYDVIILTEVIEHIPKKRGMMLLKNLYKKCNLGISLSFPGTFKEGSRNNWPNPYELHRCLWTPEDIKKEFKNVYTVGKSAAVHIIK